jgi:tetratricopeptide (TPR) repeat protein
MKKNIQYIFLLLLILLAAGCKKFTDVLPRGISVAKTTTDFRKLLDDVDNQRYQYSLAQVSAYVDIISDDVYADSTKWLSWTTTRQHVNALYAFEPQVWLYPTLADDVNWKNQYYIISLIGTIIIELKKVTDNPQLKSQLESEARVHRAYAYLNLVNIYGKHYNAATASSDPGVPMYEDATSLPPLVRQPVQKVYDYVLNELKSAVPGLPDNFDTYTHRPSKAAAYAILARAYLYMGKYTEALDYAEKSLAINNYLHDYNTLYTGADYINNLNGMRRNSDREVLLHKTTSKGFLLNNYMILDSASFNKLYPGFTQVGSVTTNYDLRRTLKFTGFNAAGSITGKTLTYSVSYNNWYKTDGSNSSAADNIHIGTPEMYLVRAEANARLNKLQKALDDVNLIRSKRFKTGTHVPVTLADLGADPAKVLNEVLLERRRELYGKELRLFDIKRLHLPVTHYISSRRLDLPADDPKLLWPIFTQYINMNPELAQNPR